MQAKAGELLAVRRDPPAVVDGAEVTKQLPRLCQVRVEVGPVAGAQSSLFLIINAELTVGLFTEPVSFPVTLNSKSGTAEMNDSQ